MPMPRKTGTSSYAARRSRAQPSHDSGLLDGLQHDVPAEVAVLRPV